MSEKLRKDDIERKKTTTDWLRAKEAWLADLRRRYENLQWVPQAIDSILWQQSVECFIHLINDDSPENDAWLREKYASRQNLFGYRNRRILGPYRSVHQEWPFMKTDNFAVQDSDDLSYPHRLWFSIQALETHGAEIFGGVMEQFLEPSPLGDGAQHHEFAQR